MNKPKILLVMHNMPIHSGFLAFKFIELVKHMNIHLMVWDDEKRIESFIQKNGIDRELRKRIHKGINTGKGILWSGFKICKVIMSNAGARKHLLQGEGSFIEKIKKLVYYLPVFALKPDIIHFEFGTLAKDLLLLKSLTRARISVSFRGYDLNYVGLEDIDYYSDVWQGIDGAHFLGQDLKKRAVQRGYEQAATEMIIPPAVQTDFFNAVDKSVSGDKLRIVSVGRLTWKKGYDIGIQAVALLKQKNIPFEYRIIGDGNFLQPLQFAISELGLQNEVSLMGAMTAAQVKEQMQDAHVFFHPAISEGFSNAVLEAQAMGLPVVCTDADGLAENVSDKETGFVVPKWDPKALAERLEWCYYNKQLAVDMGKRGIERVNTRFKAQDQVNAFIEFYQKIYASR